MKAVNNITNRLFLLIILLCLNGCTPDREPLTTVILVRHAEKSDQGGDDMPLSDEGYQRADLLADMLADLDITAIYSTQWQRNQLTAKPLSDKFGAPVTTLTIDDAAQHARELAAELKRPDLQGKTVVCIEHSNTIALILNELGISGFRQDAQYVQMFLVTLSDKTKPHLSILRYGL